MELLSKPRFDEITKGRAFSETRCTTTTVRVQTTYSVHRYDGLVAACNPRDRRIGTSLVS